MRKTNNNVRGVMKKPSQLKKLAKRLANGTSLTRREAISKYRILNLCGRIHELRSIFNLPVSTVRKTVKGKTVRGYQLSPKFKQQALKITSYTSRKNF